MSRERKRAKDADSTSNTADPPSLVKRPRNSSRNKQDSAVAITRTLSTVADIDEADSSCGSRFPSLVAELDAQQGSDKFLATFTVQVKEDKKELKALLAKREQEAREKLAEKSRLHEAVSLLLQQKPDFYSLEASAILIIKESNNLIGTYEELAAEDEAMKHNMVEENERSWKQDKDHVIDLLAKGKELSLSRVKASLPIPTPSYSATPPADAASDNACDEISRWFRSKPNDELPETFRHTAKGLRRITKYLPAPTNVRSVDQHLPRNDFLSEGDGVRKDYAHSNEGAPEIFDP